MVSKDSCASMVLNINSDRKNVFEKHIEHALGSLEVEMTDEQLQKKFIDQSELVIGKSAQAASDVCWKLEEVEDVSRLIAQL